MRVQLFKDINIIYQAEQRLSFYDVIQHLWEGKAEIVQWDGETVVIKEKETSDE